MHRVGNWLGRGRLHQSSSSHSLNSLEESQSLITALKAVELIMDDDLKGAEEGLSQGHSAFHALCKGVLGFLRATLGFEQDVMREAAEQLSTAENTAYNDHYRAQRESRAFSSNIYEKGAEFSLCMAMSQIMGCVVGVLNESLTESIKGFYKLRKAYWTLDSIMQMEQAAAKSGNLANSSRPQSRESGLARTPNGINAAQISGHNSANASEETVPTNPSGLRAAQHVDDDDDHDDDDEFYEADDIQDNNEVTKEYAGNLQTGSVGNSTTSSMSKLSVQDSTVSDSTTLSQDQLPTANNYNLLTADPGDPIFESPMDSFIHSGTNLCYGLISLMISMIPPAFGKLLYIIGFRGDREKGIRMLWQASKFENINGAMAGLIILGWYNGLVGFCDIIPEPDAEGIEGYPVHRLTTLLATMRARYPKSHFWLIEEGRMCAAARNLDGALELILAPRPKSQLKQLQALGTFEKSMTAMHAHRYQLCSDSFIACVDLNNWSQALYYYIAASAHLELYRKSKDDPSKSKETAKHRKLAEEYYQTAPTKTGVKKVMGRQLPFDQFVTRKINKWTARAKSWHCDFIDAIGVSPLEEMVLLWNGYKKMNAAQLHDSLVSLAWSESPSNSHWHHEDVDEKCILAVLRANVYRNLRQHQKSRDILRKEILSVDHSEFKGHDRDNWTAPCAHYEMAVNLWMERTAYIRAHGWGLAAEADDANNTESASTLDANRLVATSSLVTTNAAAMATRGGRAIPELDIEHDRKLVAEAKVHIDKVKNWEKYQLDARIGIKVTAAWDALKKWEEKHGASG